MDPLNPINLRRRIHEHPELYFQENKTTELLISNISGLIEKATPAVNRENVRIKLIRPLETGLLIEYRGNDKDNSWGLLRADIDALPILEETNLPFKSKNNFMHACGHDLHTAILYGYFQEALRELPKKNLLFLFQPAEEEGGGAQKILVSDVLRQYGQLKGCFALHVTDEWEVGELATNGQTLFASAHAFDVNFAGREAHLAFPEMGKNAFNALRVFLDRAEDWVRENRDRVPSLVWGVGKIESGFVRNILPGKATLSGSLRGLNRGETDIFFNALEGLLKEIEKEYGVLGSIHTVSFYPALINSKTLYDEVRPSLEKNFKFTETEPKMTGEDFGFISEKYPSLMVWLGAREKGSPVSERKGLHHPQFSPSEKAIELGIRYFSLMTYHL